MKISFTLPIAPRTKKTHNNLVPIGKPCQLCGRAAQKIQPSKQYAKFFREAMKFAPILLGQLRCAGVELPIREPVSCAALFFSDLGTGDLSGYMQGLGDWLQANQYKCRQSDGSYKIRTVPTGNCKVYRTGAGIILDDRLIASWDGSRLLKDSKRPRIEVTLETIEDGQGELFEP